MSCSPLLWSNLIKNPRLLKILLCLSDTTIWLQETQEPRERGQVWRWPSELRVKCTHLCCWNVTLRQAWKLNGNLLLGERETKASPRNPSRIFQVSRLTLADASFALASILCFYRGQWQAESTWSWDPVKLAYVFLRLWTQDSVGECGHQSHYFSMLIEWPTTWANTLAGDCWCKEVARGCTTRWGAFMFYGLFSQTHLEGRVKNGRLAQLARVWC